MMVVVVGDGHYCFVVFVSSGVSVVVIVIGCCCPRISIVSCGVILRLRPHIPRNLFQCVGAAIPIDRFSFLFVRSYLCFVYFQL